MPKSQGPQRPLRSQFWCKHTRVFIMSLWARTPPFPQVPISVGQKWEPRVSTGTVFCWLYCLGPCTSYCHKGFVNMALGYCCQDNISLSDGNHDLCPPHYCILYLKERQEKDASPLYCGLIRTMYWGACPQIQLSLNAKHRINPTIPAAVTQLIRELSPAPFLSYS